MKRLIIVRHAKSSWEGNLDDRDRPLNGRGERDIQLVASTAKTLIGEQPDAIWTSPAKRAHSTAMKLTAAMGYPAGCLSVIEELYTFNHRNQMAVIAQCDDDHDSLMIFSHNHGLTDLINHLTSEELSNLPTCGMAIIDLPIPSWKSVANSQGVLVQSLYPRDLK